MMTTTATLEKMYNMKLYGMHASWKSILDTGAEEEMDNDQMLSHLIASEWEDRYVRKTQRLLRTAKLRVHATIEKIDFLSKRTLNKMTITRLAECHWISKNENVILTGPTGVGKSYVGCALCHQACVNEKRVLYFNSGKLFSDLKIAKADGTYRRRIEKLKKVDVVMIDDFGLHPIDRDGRLALLDILEDRYGSGALILTTQVPISGWHDLIGDKTIADAICDRLVHNAHRIQIDGESYRKFQAKDLT